MKVPEGWTWLRCEKVVEVSPGSSSELLGDIDVSFLGMADVSEDGKVSTAHRRKVSEVSNGFTYFENNDVLVAKITPCFENGKGALVSNLVNGRGFGSTEFHVLRAKPQIEPEFLFLLTRTHAFRANGEKHMVGSAGQKRVPEVDPNVWTTKRRN
jgi:type I restriction enzyme S subunit